MVAKRTEKPQATNPPDFVEVAMSKGTISFRTALMLMIFAATPPGQQVLKNFGLTAPGAEGVSQMHRDIETVRKDVVALKADVSAVKDQATKLEAQATKLESSVTGFRVDFERFRSSQTAPQ